MSANNSFTSAPAFVLPPNGTNGYFSSDGYPISALDPQGATLPSTPNGSALPTPGSIAGRKRSRADIFDPEEEEEAMRERDVTAAAVYGTPSSEIGIPISDNDAMMMEEALGHPQPEQGHVKRPSISCRKSQRMAAPETPSDDLAQLLLPPQMREVTKEPLIDEATRMLGISWTRMSSTEALQISQAAYSKWIDHHYSRLTNVSVWFENTAIPGYLVAAQNAYTGQQEFYIFSNDLTEARLVTNEPSQLLSRLQMMPALHLVAPGGCIKADTERMTAPADGVGAGEAEMETRSGAQVSPDIIEVSEPSNAVSFNKTSHNRNMSANDYYGFMHSGLMARLCSAHEMEMD